MSIQKKKILFITPSLCQGGLEHSLITLLKILDKDKYDITLFVYLTDLTLLPTVPKEVKVINDTLRYHYYRKPTALLLQFLIIISKIFLLKRVNLRITDKLNRYIRGQKVKYPSKRIFQKEKFDIVVSNSIGMSSEIAAHINAERRFVFFHSSVDLHHEMSVKLFPKYDGIVAVSQGVKDMLCSNYSDIDDKVFVLENYVDANNIIEQSKEIIAFPEHLKGHNIVLSTCGRFSEEKGFDLAVESANILKKKGIDFVWFFIGDGNKRVAIEDLIRKYSLEENIIITGYTDNPFPYIKACDVYIQPSYHESFGLTIKEAVILGKAVVSTDTVGGNTVLENGKYGEIVLISPMAIADGIIAAFEKEKLGIYTKYDVSKNQKEKDIYISKLESIINT